MPANVVKTEEDEKKWEKAKELAAEQGHAEEWDYIMGIYKKMKPDYFKGKESSLPGLTPKEAQTLSQELVALAALYPQTADRVAPVLRRLFGDFR